jgi:exosortase H (IPTLxxWG-CTERM-specific)
MALFYASTTGAMYDQFLAEYLNVSARLSSLLLNCFGMQSFVSGLTIESDRFAFTVQRGCDAVEPSWIFLSAVISFKARITRKILGILLGVAFLNIFNLVRIASLFAVGVRSPEWFNTIHLEVWPAAFLLLSLLLLAAWIKWTGRDNLAG